jgi:hypothetical protein
MEYDGGGSGDDDDDENLSEFLKFQLFVSKF